MNFGIFLDHYPLFLEGLLVTVALVSVSLALGLVLALPLALARHFRVRVLGRAVMTFTWFFRGTPLLLQIYLIYYGSGQFELIRQSFLWHFLAEAYFCGALALTLNTCAYTTEIIHGALNTADEKETEAARAFGMSRYQTYRYVVIPEALRRCIPPYGNEVIFMFHGSAVISVITIMDLTGAARYLYAKYYDPFTPFVLSGLFYLALVSLVVFLFGKLEKRFMPHLRTETPRSEDAKARTATSRTNGPAEPEIP